MPNRVIVGFDVVVLDDDGRIDTVLGFLDKVPAASGMRGPTIAADRQSGRLCALWGQLRSARRSARIGRN